MAPVEALLGASTLFRLQCIVATAIIGIVVALVPSLDWRDRQGPAEALTIAPPLGMPGAPATSPEGLRQRITEMEKRVLHRPGDTGAAVLLADALLRQARVRDNGRLAGRAGDVLKAVLKEQPAHYEAKRMLGAVYLSQHRFREALELARVARDQRPEDAWNYGIIGDAHLEIGDYEQAFDAFDTMVTMRPSAAAYARVAYARELQGNLEGALQAMQMAAEATTAHDPEAQAWYGAQVGNLFFTMGKLAEAAREYHRAVIMFPNHPLAMIGQAKLKAAGGDREGALAIFLEQVKRTPTLDLAARIGDLYAEQGDPVEAERYYRMAENLAGPSRAQTEATLATFLAERDRKLPEAVQVAETVAAVRHDIFTEDALAWAYYKVGRLAEAFAASQRALRTGTRDPHILAHAAAIRQAAGRQTAGSGL